jgi:hypothetical protein
MINIRASRLLPGTGILFLACMLSIGCALIPSNNGIRPVKVEDAARKVGAEPTLNGLADHIAKSVQLGMSREQVEQTLNAMAPCTVVQGPQKDIDIGWGANIM